MYKVSALILGKNRTLNVRFDLLHLPGYKEPKTEFPYQRSSFSFRARLSMVQQPFRPFRPAAATSSQRQTNFGQQKTPDREFFIFQTDFLAVLSSFLAGL
uniref:Uncharacterized protein n=1 Tax=Cacopsylla melanoneura TaxID=428564 RepID=A0A8D9A830_9HEMI